MSLRRAEGDSFTCHCEADEVGRSSPIQEEIASSVATLLPRNDKQNALLSRNDEVFVIARPERPKQSHHDDWKEGVGYCNGILLCL